MKTNLRERAAQKKQKAKPASGAAKLFQNPIVFIGAIFLILFICFYALTSKGTIWESQHERDQRAARRILGIER